MNNNHIREIVKRIEAGGVEQLLEAAEEFRRAGYVAGECVGHTDWYPEKVVRWYVGQGISLAEKEAYFAVNAWINMLDSCVPEEP